MRTVIVLALAISTVILFAAAPDASAGMTCFTASSYSANFVAAVQTTLAKAGFDPGPQDGKWGPKTRRALKHYQAHNNLRVTGDLNEPTLRSLFGPTTSPASYGLTPGPPEMVYEKWCR